MRSSTLYLICVHITLLAITLSTRASEVTPGEIEIIPYEATQLPYSTQMRMLTTFKNPQMQSNIRE